MSVWLSLLLFAAVEAEAGACTPAIAISTTVEAVASNPGQWLARCVTVTGPALGRSIYSDVEGFYLIRQRDDTGHVPRRHLRHRIGLYLTDHLLPGETLEQWSVTGTVDSCERRADEARRQEAEENRRLREAGSEEIMILMLGGYCHYYPGAVIDVVAVERGPDQDYHRLVGADARDRFGNLVFAPSRWRHLARFRRMAEAFRAAVATRDRERLSALHGRFGADPEELDHLLRNSDSVFREMRGGAAFPFAIFVEAFDQEGRSPEHQRYQDGYICYCRSEDCRNVWPISDVDARDHPEHPYACLRVSEDGAGYVFLNSVGGHSPLQEPQRRSR